MKTTIQKLNQLKDTPYEKWNLRLKAVSINSNGMVNSGKTKCGTFFFRENNQFIQN